MNGLTKSLTRLVGIALLASPLAVLAVPPSVNKCNPTIALTSASTPVIDGDTLTITEDVTVAGFVNGSGSNQCNLSVGTHVNDGRLEIFQVRAGSIGVSCALLTSPPTKVCSAGDPIKIGASTCTNDTFCDSLAVGDGVCSPVKTAGNSLARQPDPPGVTTTSGTLNVDVATAGVGGSTLGFLGTYNGAANAGINDAATICFDVPVEEKQAIACESGALISIKKATGPGAPTPGTTNNWQYEVTVEACEHLDDVTAQGGTNGWAPLTNRLASSVSGSALHPSGFTSAAVRNANKKNEVILWTIGAMDLGQKETLTVDLSGSIPPKTADCQLRYLSGPWSTTFKIAGATLKSDYTGRVSIFVTLDGDSRDCIAP